jgi:Putative polyhydroxyalkanoic acid system protein (PHA_gran_rgn)
MSTPLSINIPHSLGKEEAHRRIAEGFGKLQQQMTGGLFGLVSFDQRWEGDRLHFDGGGLGQKVSGRIEVQPDAVQIQLDLPPMLAAIADRIAGKVKNEGQKLLGKS